MCMRGLFVSLNVFAVVYVCMHDTQQYIKSAAPWMRAIGHIIMMVRECKRVCTALAGPV